MDYFLREKKVNLPTDLEFQLIDIQEEDNQDYKYQVNFFGLTEEGHSVHVQANGFRPYFYLKVPKTFRKDQLYSFVEYLTEKYFSARNYSFKIIDEAKLVKRIDFQGFRNGKKDRFVKLFFKGKRAFCQLRYYLKNLHEQLKFNGMDFWPKMYESKMDPFLSLIHEQDLRTAGWMKVEHFMACSTSKCQIGVQTNFKNLIMVDKQAIAPIFQASFDIECVAADGVSFPEWRKSGDVINQIGTTMYIYGKDNSKPLKHIVTLKSCDPIEGVIVESYATESAMLLAWVKILERLQPDILTGYNIYQFDFEYIYERAKKLGIASAFHNLSRLRSFESIFYTKELSSAALGDNRMKYFITPGMLHIDLLKVIQRDYKLESYKLDNVASEFIKGKIKNVEVDNDNQLTKLTINPSDAFDLEVGNYVGICLKKLQYYEQDNKNKWQIIEITDNIMVINGSLELPKDILLEWALKKDDLPPTELFKYQDIDSKHRMIIAKYCIMDNILCNKLLDKLKIITNNVGMANVCNVPMSYIFLRGQGIKAYSLVGKQCKKDGYLIPDFIPTSDQTFQGATVLTAKTGAYFEPVACNDFSSLYPSSIISHNLSPDTLIVDGHHEDEVKTQDIRWEDKDDNGNITNTYCYTFTVPDGDENHDEEYQRARKGRGIIPRVLIKLLKNRKEVKKRMAKETDPFQKSLLDGLQLSYKLTCNSIYGQMGSSFSPICCMPVAMCTTSIGRQLLMTAADVMKARYPDGQIVYGDSVTGDTPLLLRDQDKRILHKTIEELNNEWTSYEELKPFDTVESNRREKQQSTTDLEVWSKDGWNPIIRVIRHKCNKHIYEVTTEHGSVKVTGDHSLIDINGKYVKPTDCSIGDQLLHSMPQKGNYSGNILSIQDLGITNCFVFDLETELGTFSSLSTLCLTNTDSIFYQYPSPDNCKTTEAKIAYAIKCAQDVEYVVSMELPWPHLLEFEKSYCPYFLISKKRYMGIMYELDPKHYTKVDTKGIVLKRRDNAKIVKYIYGGALDIILFQLDIKKAHDFVRKSLLQLINNEFSWDLLVVTKALKKTKTTPAHAILAARIAKRDPGNAPRLNDRIPYMFRYIDSKTEKKMCRAQNRKTLLQGDRIETPDFMKKNNLKPDFVFYITNQLLKPLQQFLAVFVKYENPRMTEAQLIKHKEMVIERDIFLPIIARARREQKGMKSITDYF